MSPVEHGQRVPARKPHGERGKRSQLLARRGADEERVELAETHHLVKVTVALVRDHDVLDAETGTVEQHRSAACKRLRHARPVLLFPSSFILRNEQGEGRRPELAALAAQPHDAMRVAPAIARD
jgi:hypothetical protein